MIVNKAEELHSKEAALARRERGVKAVAWILYHDGRMEEKDAETLEGAKRMAEEGIAAGASSASFRTVKSNGKTKVVEILSPHDNCDWID